MISGGIFSILASWSAVSLRHTSVGNSDVDNGGNGWHQPPSSVTPVLIPARKELDHLDAFHRFNVSRVALAIDTSGEVAGGSNMGPTGWWRTRIKLRRRCAERVQHQDNHRLYGGREPRLAPPTPPVGREKIWPNLIVDIINVGGVIWNLWIAAGIARAFVLISSRTTSPRAMFVIGNSFAII